MSISASYLLDTHALLWALASPALLSTRARNAIETETIVLSVVSYWEVMIKTNKGTLSVGDPVVWWNKASRDLAATSLQLRTSHVSALKRLPDHHRDPFDRILIAQALEEGLILITNDEKFKGYPIEVCW